MRVFSSSDPVRSSLSHSVACLSQNCAPESPAPLVSPKAPITTSRLKEMTSLLLKRTVYARETRAVNAKLEAGDKKVESK